ncbi:class II fructose-bisphosphate aldolase [Patescibacteria group bacterium]|nr:class II fructose-bisphosphate aldolase [Patescibacteria group bacterium]MBU1663683.1 class II fructose-bisphosphate aldolase [Patescibacteria group bacterium]MBU1933962.1 class II fructose-bisphosphate aldolase [Patescibacteria group bacterium]MBU2007855.1 class II fructose-bisphosphate aldolase [Patescibacteria group bacterium]MBU2233389.1 class II fructose-bisphosphate aldolase [Patescibacteria group bacterium]
MLVHIKDLVKDAKKNGYAIGAFNITNLESVLGVAQAAVKTNSPAIIQVSESAIRYMGLKPITHIVSTVAKNVATNVPIALHLDHGTNFDNIFECINAGFSSVHIDASNLPLDENINLTKQVVKVAHAKHVWVQGEVGAIVGSHDDITSKLKKIPLAKLDEVINFVIQTKVDTIAAAIGTAHGVHANENIVFSLLKAIKDKVKTPFVLHGGSGVLDAKIKKAIKEGVNIINIGTDLKVAFCRTLIEVCLKSREETDPRNLLKPTIAAIKKVVSGKMKLFGSAGRAGGSKIET